MRTGDFCACCLCLGQSTSLWPRSFLSVPGDEAATVPIVLLHAHIVDAPPPLVDVVASAPQLDVVFCLLSTLDVGVHVVEFEKGALAAPATIRTHERAAALVARADGAPDVRRDVPRIGRRWLC